MPLKVLWISDSPLLATGFGRVTREVTTRLSRHPRIEVACLAFGYGGWPYDREKIPFTMYPSDPASHGQDNLERATAEFTPDVVVTLGEIWTFEWLHTHSARPRFKWVGYFPLDGGPFYPPWERMLKDVDELVAMSEFGRKIFQQGIPAKRTHLIYHGVDTSSFRPLPDRDRIKAHPRFRDKFVIGCVARNQSRKQIPALVKAVSLLRETIDNLHLYLHMDPCDVGYDLVTLLHRYRMEGYADISDPDLSLRDSLDDVQLNRLYNLFDVTVLPTAGEGFGLPLIESMAAGVPVIGTDCSSCSELLENRGELVRVAATITEGINLIDRAITDIGDLAACIERLYANPNLRARHADAGLAFARTLKWDSLMPKWLEVISLATGTDLAEQSQSALSESASQP